jgi:hypothetical protein
MLVDQSSSLESFFVTLVYFSTKAASLGFRGGSVAARPRKFAERSHLLSRPIERCFEWTGGTEPGRGLFDQ